MDKEQLIAKIREYHQFFIDMATGKHVGDKFYETYEEKRSELLQLDQSILSAIPPWIYQNKYGSSFWKYIKGISNRYQERRNFINEKPSSLRSGFLEVQNSWAVLFSSSAPCCWM